MKPIVRTVLLVLGTIALIVGVVIGSTWLRNGLATRSATTMDSGVAVLVSVRPQKAGVLLRPDDIAWKPFGKGVPPPASYEKSKHSEAELVGAVLTRDFAEGEIFASTGLVEANSRNFLAATLEQGYRAVTLSIEAPQSASGLVQPGDRVDVVLVRDVGGDTRDPRAKGETILRNSRVVAVGRVLSAAQKAAPGVQSQEAAVPKTITIETLPVDAERIFVAQHMGRLDLALRPLGDVDTGPLENGAATQVPVTGLPAKPRAVSSHRAAGPSSSEAVVILRGSKIDDQK